MQSLVSIKRKKYIAIILYNTSLKLTVRRETARRIARKAGCGQVLK